MEQLIGTMVKPLLDFPDELRIETEEDGNRVIFSLSVHPEDVGKVIGKQGRTAKAIRSIVYSAAAGKDDGRNVVINIAD